MKQYVGQFLRNGIKEIQQSTSASFSVDKCTISRKKSFFLKIDGTLASIILEQDGNKKMKQLPKEEKAIRADHKAIKF